MARGMKAVAVGAAGLVGGAVAARRSRSERRPDGVADGHAVTILAPADDVRSAWEALVAGADVPAADVDVRPAPGDRGTELVVRLREGGDAGGDGPVEKVKGEAPDQRLRAELRRLKSRLECGTVVTTEGQPSGRGPAQEAVTRAVTDRLRAWGAA